jgi:alpha-1,3-rhamnosyltransferase
MKEPLVTVVVPSYNHSKYIEKCLDSIFEQTYKNLEVIVIDDGSKDKSPIILTELKNKYNFYLILQSNKGISATFNRAIKEFSHGKYFTFCASDDKWLPNKIELQVDYLEKHDLIPMVYGKAMVINTNDQIIEDSTKEINKNLKGGNIFKDLLCQNFHPPVNYMIRTDLFSQVGNYDEQAWAEDFDMNLKISNLYPIGFINELISYYRRGDNSNSSNAYHKITESHLYSIRKYKNSEFYPLALKKWHYRNFIWNAKYKNQKLSVAYSMTKTLDFLFTKEYLKSVRSLLLDWH